MISWGREDNAGDRIKRSISFLSRFYLRYAVGHANTARRSIFECSFFVHARRKLLGVFVVRQAYACAQQTNHTQGSEQETLHPPFCVQLVRTLVQVS